MADELIEITQEELEKFKAQADEYLNGWKRAKADFVNYQKQMERERAEWAMFANASCVKAMLPVLDSLEMAALQHRRHSEPQIVISTEAKRSGEISHGASMQGVGSLDSARDDEKKGDSIGVAHGIVKIRDQMVETLKQMGVEQIKSVGEPVNPEFHEVIATEPSEEHASGLITKEAQRGYTMHGKVLRVAKVIVSE